MSSVTADARFSNIAESYDVIIVGGGIYGAAMAWEGSCRGLSVVLLEKGDFGSGTSANSLKTIHGGLRYLQTLNFKRIKESVKAQRLLLKIAPHLVQPLQCVMPTYRELSKSKIVLWVAMWLYHLLTLRRNVGLSNSHRLVRGGVFSTALLKKLAPGIVDEGITGGAYWMDAQAHNTERLVLAFILTAQEKSAHVFNYAEVEDYCIENGQITGVEVKDKIAGKNVSVNGQVVIDCRGPWLGQENLLPSANSAREKGQHTAKKYARAVNLVISNKITECALGIKAKRSSAKVGENRLLFVAPWQSGSIVGTWYYSNEIEPDNLALSNSELANCLAEINSVYPKLNLTPSDVTNVHLGLLPMDAVHQMTNEPILTSQYSIQDMSNYSNVNGLFTVQGVKYTTAPIIAQLTIDRVVAAANLPSHKNANKPLVCGSIDNTDRFIADKIREYSGNVSELVIKRLVANFGTKIDTILHTAKSDPKLWQLIPGSNCVLKAEIDYVLDNEMAWTLADLIFRRTDLGSFSMPSGQTLQFCADIMAHHCGWDENKRQIEIQNVMDLGRL